MPMTSQEQVQDDGRTGRKRTRNGCITCRIRRVKCDETKPDCTRCLKSGRTCDGYASEASRLSRRTLAVTVRDLHVIGPASRVLSGPLPGEDTLCFDFFRRRTAPMTAALFPSEFWSNEMLQVAHVEPAAWNAAVALGALHRRWECRAAERSGGISDNRDDTAKFTTQGLKHYCEALSSAKEIREPRTLLALSLAMAAVTNLAGKWADGLVHIRSGLRLLRHMQADEAYVARADLGSAAQSLERLDLLAMAFSDTRAPYRYDPAETMKLVEPLGKPTTSWTAAEPQYSAGAIITLLRDALLVFGAIEEGQMQIGHFVARVDGILQRTISWEHHFKGTIRNLAARKGSGDAAGQRPAILSIMIYHATVRLLLKAASLGPESRWDESLPYFDRIVSSSAELARTTQTPHAFFMSLEPGIVIPLFLATARCRHPIVRRQALTLLKNLDWQEGMWNCAGAAAVAEQIVLVEEEGLRLDMPLHVEQPSFLRPTLGIPEMAVWLEDDSHCPSGVGWDGWPRIPTAQLVERNEVRVDMEAGTVEVELWMPGDGTGEVVKRTAAVKF